MAYVKKTQFACMKKYKNKTYGILYQLGYYHVAEIVKTNKGVAFIIKRQYKTIHGAERYLLNLTGVCDSATKPEIIYGTEDYIRKGEHLNDYERGT